jgi:chemotaxis methyl-accepting protein methylase
MSGAVQVATRLLAERTGMQVGDGLRERLAGCLEEAARVSGQTPEGYAAGLAGNPAAFQGLLDCVTVQESGFFRHPDQFAALGREVLPALESPVVVWSAGCANGQEAYSLAMELAASGHADWQLVATDISATAVARARAGRYSTAELHGLPAAHRRWLRPAGDLWEVDPALRRHVRVERANLTERFPVEPGRCQVVFCRNVLIYLDRQVSGAFLDRLVDWLAPDGLIFLGYSEAVLAPTDRLRVEWIGETNALRAAFRKAVFLDPDHAVAWFQLGLALGAVEDRRGASRAYAAALAALDRCDREAVQAGLDGWPADELAGVLRAKLGRP